MPHSEPARKSSKAASNDFALAAITADDKKIAIALAQGPSQAAIAKHGTLALVVAIGSGKMNLTKALLAAGANPNAIATDLDDYDDLGAPPLARAALMGKPLMIKTLLAAGALIDGQDARGITALMWAASHGQAASASALLAAGADPLAGAPQHSIMDLAAKSGSHEIIDMLARAGADPNKAQGAPYNHLRASPLQIAARRGHGNACAALLAAGAEPNPKNKALSPLLLAAMSGNEDCARLLAALGCELRKIDRAQLRGLPIKAARAKGGAPRSS